MAVINVKNKRKRQKWARKDEGRVSKGIDYLFDFSNGVEVDNIRGKVVLFAYWILSKLFFKSRLV